MAHDEPGEHDVDKRAAGMDYAQGRASEEREDQRGY
jgi:hypothetical protein